MAASTISARSQEALDVSQNADSSPHGQPHAVQVGGGTVEIVEDSYPMAYVVAAKPRQIPDENDEDLYNVSPKPRGNVQGQRGRHEATGPPVKVTPRAPSVTPGPHITSMGKEQKDTAEVARSSLDLLLTEGATVHNRQPKSRTPTHERKESTAVGETLNGPRPVVTSAPNALNIASSTLVANEAQVQPATSNFVKPSTTRRQPNGLPTPGITGKRRTAVPPNPDQSALEALRARRSGESATRTPIAKPGLKQSREDATVTNAIPLQKPTTALPKSGPAGAAEVSLTGRKEAAPSLDAAPASARTVKSNKSVFDIYSEDDSIAVAVVQPKKHTAPKTAVKRPIKPSARVQPQRGATPDTEYESAENDDEDDNDEEFRPVKKVRSSKKVTTAKGLRKSATNSKQTKASSLTKSSTPAIAKRSRTQAGKPISTKVPDPAESTSKRNTAKDRMKALEPNNSVDNADAQPALRPKKSKPNTAATSIQYHVQEGDVDVLRHDETLEDFESKIVQHVKHHEFEEAHEAVTKASDRIKVKKEAAKQPTLADQSIHDASGKRRGDDEQLDAGPGCSQDNAIVLTDEHSVTPEIPEVVQDRRLPPATRPRNEKRKVLETPANMHSSPPVRHSRAVPTSKPHHLVDTAVSNRSNLISFDKFGPRNQGALSAAKGHTQSSRASQNPFASGAVASASAHGDQRQNKRRTADASTPPAAAPKDARYPRVMSPVTVADNVPDALASFSRAIPGNGGRKDTPIPGHGRRENREVTIPVDDDGYINIDDINVPETSHQIPRSPVQGRTRALGPRTTSQKAMPPPAVKPISSLMPPSNHTQRSQKAPVVPSMADSTTFEAGVLSQQHTMIILAGKGGSASPPPDSTHLKRMRPAVDIAAVRSNPALTQEQRPQKVQRKSRKPPRTISHGSQSVDIGGSPVPQGMVVRNNSTVLETFSQQASISSDDVNIDTVVIRQPKRSPIINDSGDAHISPRANTQPAILASNRKSRPALPGEQSRAITTHALTVEGQLQVNDKSLRPDSNPFKSSEGSQRSENIVFSSSFVEKLRDIVAERDRAREQQGQEHDPDKTLIAPSTAKNRSKRPRSLSSSSKASSKEDEEGAAMHDIGVWRSALLQHQADFFDELVVVSHSVVRHLVDAETATKDATNDLRRLALREIEKIEQERAAQYRKTLSEVEAREKSLRMGLANCSRKLRDGMQQAAAAQKQRQINQSIKNETIEELRSLMAEYS